MRVIPPVPITSMGSFTRSTTGTCYNSIGLVTTVGVNLPRFNYNPSDLTAAPTLLIESATTNLCTYSEAFDNAAWTKVRSSVSSNVTTSPDGTSSADKLVEDSSASNTHYCVQTPSVSAATLYTFSVFLKSSTRTKANIVLDGGSGNFANTSVDLSSGTITSGSASGSFTEYSSQITNVGNGWYRVYTTSRTAGSTTTLQCQIRLVTSSDIYTGDGTSGIFMWGAQLEANAASTSYIPTVASTVLRAADTYSGTGLIYSNVVENSVNLLSYTEDFGNTTYWITDNAGVSTGVVNDPVNNYLTADSLTKVGTKSGFAHLRQVVSVGTGQNVGKTYTASVWLWCASGTKSAALVISDVSYNSYTGTTITVTTTPTRYTFSSNGGGAWNASGSSIAFGIDLAAATNGDMIYIFGAQLEVGSSASSYVQSYITEPIWTSGVTYPQGTIVSRNTTTHRRYQKLTSAAGSTTPPENDGVNWFDTGPDNRWAMFALDRSVGTYNPNSIQIIIAPGQRIDSLGLIGLEADRVDICMYATSGLQYSYSEVLKKRETLSWKDYFLGGFATDRPTFIRYDIPSLLNCVISVVISKIGGVAKCSALVVGQNVYLGSTQNNPKSEALNFSKVDRDAYGNSTLVPRRSVPKTSQELFLEAKYVNAVRDARTSLNATPALWSGLDDKVTDNYFESLLILGIYKEFTIDLENSINARVTLQLEEL